MEGKCSLCLDNFQHDPHITKCGHKFHHNCLSEWLKKQECCPDCPNLLIRRLYLPLTLNIGQMEYIPSILLPYRGNEIIEINMDELEKFNNKNVHY